MNISKLKALWSLCTGGWAGLAEYLLEAVNDALKKFDRTRLAQFAQVVQSVSNAVNALVPLMPSKCGPAVSATVGALNEMALSLADGNVTPEELDAMIDGVEFAIEKWRSASAAN